MTHSTFAPPAIALTLTLTAAGLVIPYCTYGTENNPDATTWSQIGSTIIDVIAGASAIALGQPGLVPYIETTLLAIEGSTLRQPDCTRLPDPVEPLDLSIGGVFNPTKRLEWFDAAYWHYFCRCTPAPPGGADPSPPPPPDVINPPPELVTQTPEYCDNNDICTTLNRIETTIAGLALNLSYARRDIQVIQRQNVPFAYIPNVVFSALSGSGELAVSDILALSVESTTVPSTLSLISADPVEYRFLGRISLGTADGWMRQVMISHNPHLVLPIDGTVTRIGYSLAAGVVANVQTFKMEPLG
jgi:hypothetical protein